MSHKPPPPDPARDLQKLRRLTKQMQYAAAMFGRPLGGHVPAAPPADALPPAPPLPAPRPGTERKPVSALVPGDLVLELERAAGFSLATMLAVLTSGEVQGVHAGARVGDPYPLARLSHWDTALIACRKHYPGTCPRCGCPAYVGAVSRVDCAAGCA